MATHSKGASMKKKLEEAAGTLQQWKNNYSLKGDLSSEATWVLLAPHVSITRLHIKAFEQYVGKGTWEELDEWFSNLYKFIESADQTLRETEKHDANGLSVQLAKREFGPNYESHLEGISKMSGCNSGAFNRIPLDIMQAKIKQEASVIIEHWKDLQHDNRLEMFRATWTVMDGFDRQMLLGQWKGWKTLQKRPLGLQAKPCLEIIGWAQGNQLDQHLFLTSLLNIEDMVEGTNMYTMLKARSQLHPETFRRIDARSIEFGLWHGYLPSLACEGRVYYQPGEQDSYGLCVKNEGDGITTLLGYANEAASVAFYRLHAQRLIYAFFADWLNFFQLNQGTNNSIERPLCSCDETNVQSVTTLTQAARLDFNPVCGVDIQYLKDSLYASLDEARHDLWRLRGDSDYWLSRMKEIPMEGRAFSLLESTFCRVDIFDILTRAVANIQPSTQYILSQSEDGDTFHDLITLEVMLKSAFNSTLASLSGMQRSFPTSSPILARLFELIETDHPTIRVMGPVAFLRAIECQMPKASNVSFRIMQALNDMSVLACCTREVLKIHFARTSTFEAYATQANRLQAEMQDSHGPWKLFCHTLPDIPQQIRNKIDRITQTSLPTETQLYQFWTFVDKHMENSETRFPNLINEIRSAAPLKAPIPVQSTPVGEHVVCSASTRTQARKSKPRPDIADVMSSLSNNRVQESHLPRLVVLVHRADDKDSWEFWTDLSQLSSERRSQFHWKDFCRAMKQLGYSITPQGGSGYQFKHNDVNYHHTIVFHDYHGEKLSLIQARNWWFKRVSQRIEIILEED